VVQNILKNMAQEMVFRGINAVPVTEYFNQKEELVN